MSYKPILFHIIDDLDIGGAEVVLAGNIEALSAVYDQTLVTLSERSASSLDKIVSPHLRDRYCLGADRTRQLPLAVLKLRRLISRAKPAILHAHLQKAGLVTKLAAPRSIPLIYSLHNLYSFDAFRHNALSVWAERLTVRKHHHLVGVSQAVLDDYSRYIDHDCRTSVLYNWVSQSFFDAAQPLRGEGRGGLRCISIGSLKEQKNLQLALRAFAELRHFNIHLDIYGDGPELEMLLRLREELELEKVRFLGGVESPDTILPGYDLFLTTALYEGYAIAPMEAMAAGLPVVAPDIEVLREVFDSAPIYFTPGDHMGLALLLKRLAADNTIPWTELKERSRERALLVATQDRYFDVLRALYCDIVTPVSNQEHPLRIGMP